MEKVKIKENKEIVPGIYALTFKRFFDFIPGQVIKLTTELEIAPRMYSIASALHDTNIRIVYDIKPFGELTNILKDKSRGDDLLVSMPFGQFICTEDDAWWIATGTGIAPFYSMFASGKSAKNTLIHGVRNPEHFIFKDDFTQSLSSRYIRCCSGSQADNLFLGRVTDYLKELSALPSNKKFYLCGSAEMVVEVRDILISRGVAYGDIFSEIYF
jgi:ferredoxin--NADP+ reductase